ncbi:MAG TPA: ATP-binding protein [Gammaproteobacteria bacterium]|nr:ATP-binding protein [Gammaproteobacteria bacterium]
MDPRRNPYSPGAGTPPPELAGRDELIERAAVALYRIAHGRAARSLILYGLRGVGKTVLLRRIGLDAEEEGYIPVVIEAPEDRSLPAILGPALRATLIRLSRGEAAKKALKKAFGALASFARAARLKYQDVEFNVDFEGAPGVADSGDLEIDLTDLIRALGEAAAERETAVVLFIDELQYVPEEQLAALISALHNASQRQLPMTLVAAGLPQLLGQLGRAKSYAERLFEFVPIGPLEPGAAEQALVVPARKEGVEVEAAAIEHIVRQTEGYPYFLQEWGKHAWSEAQASPITEADAVKATDVALAELDASFFRVRFDRLTPAEKRYMRAMAQLGPGPHRSGDIAAALGRNNSAVAPVRNRLIAKGMVYSPAHGDTAFTVPLFDSFMRRIMPDFT